MFKKTICILIFSIFAVMCFAQENDIRISLGLNNSSIFGSDVTDRHEGKFGFNGGISYQLNGRGRAQALELGSRYVTRGFLEVFDRDTDNQKERVTNISYIDLYGKYKLHTGNGWIFVLGSGVSLAPFTEYYNTVNIPLIVGYEWYGLICIEADMLLLNIPVQDAYPNFNNVKSFTIALSVAIPINLLFKQNEKENK